MFQNARPFYTRKKSVPVVHEDVRLPKLVGRHPDVLDAAVLALVPPHVHVIPFLKTDSINHRLLSNSITFWGIKNYPNFTFFNLKDSLLYFTFVR